ncbi:MAG: DUF6090 family protein [Woeseiaceae bacterium]|nr:DUF6090 family protein [Woeseiaceae bacterium]
MNDLKFNRAFLFRGAAEFLIIVTGVLIALALDNWNMERQDRALGREYLGRLLNDVRADVRWSDNVLLALQGKIDALEHLRRVREDDAIDAEQANQLLQRLPQTLILSFNAPSVRTGTYDEMMSTGSLAHVTPLSLRESILSYYALGTNSENRLEGRMTRYPHNTYENVPYSVLTWYDITSFAETFQPASHRTPPESFAAEEIKSVVRWLDKKETKNLINSELNYTLQALQIIDADRIRALRLIEAIENSLRN